MSLFFRCDGCEDEIAEDNLFTIKLCIESPTEVDDPMDVVDHLCEKCLCDTETRNAFFEGLNWKRVIELIKFAGTE